MQLRCAEDSFILYYQTQLCFHVLFFQLSPRDINQRHFLGPKQFGETPTTKQIGIIA
jgi:hypothetical protein